MTKNEIWFYVKNVIEKYDLNYPLDVGSFANTLGFEIKYVDTGKSDAYTIICNGEKRILLNKNIDNKKRINFTIAHELGHYFIPHHLKSLYSCNSEQSLILNNTTEEKEADLFASKLLLPETVMQKNNCIENFEDIINLAERHNVSIPTAAIRMIEFTYDGVCFVYCNNGKIKWFIASSTFKENLKLKNLIGYRIPNLSSANTCINDGLYEYKDKVPAFVWIEEIERDMFIEEEILNFSGYNTTYILIKAENLISCQE